jgi:hypothetical protein
MTKKATPLTAAEQRQRGIPVTVDEEFEYEFAPRDPALYQKVVLDAMPGLHKMMDRLQQKHGKKR